MKHVGLEAKHIRQSRSRAVGTCPKPFSPRRRPPAANAGKGRMASQSNSRENPRSAPVGRAPSDKNGSQMPMDLRSPEAHRSVSCSRKTRSRARRRTGALAQKLRKHHWRARIGCPVHHPSGKQQKPNNLWPAPGRTILRAPEGTTRICVRIGQSFSSVPPGPPRPPSRRALTSHCPLTCPVSRRNDPRREQSV